MFHVLSMGHFDPSILAQGMIVITKPLNLDTTVELLRRFGQESESGEFAIGGFPVHFRNGYIECVWKAVGIIPQVLEFARCLHEATGCFVVDVRGREVIHPKERSMS